MANKTRTVLYVGVTSNLSARVQEHENGTGSKFTSTYNCHDLIYYKFFPLIAEAIEEEKKIKNWPRKWKEELISSFNNKLRKLNEEVNNHT